MTFFSIRTTLGVEWSMQMYLAVNLLTFPLETLGMCGCAGICLQSPGTLSSDQSLGAARIWRQWFLTRSCVYPCVVLLGKADYPSVVSVVELLLMPWWWEHYECQILQPEL